MEKGQILTLATKLILKLSEGLLFNLDSELNDEQQKMMQQWTNKHNWSTRVQMKVLRLSRTISDLSGSEKITNESIWEAVTMRRSQTGNIKKGMVK